MNCFWNHPIVVDQPQTFEGALANVEMQRLEDETMMQLYCIIVQQERVIANKQYFSN